MTVLLSELEGVSFRDRTTIVTRIEGKPGFQPLVYRQKSSLDRRPKAISSLKPSLLRVLSEWCLAPEAGRNSPSFHNKPSANLAESIARNTEYRHHLEIRRFVSETLGWVVGFVVQQQLSGRVLFYAKSFYNLCVKSGPNRRLLHSSGL